jgi:hypothetical protein
LKFSEHPELEARSMVHYEMPNKWNWPSEPGVVHEVPAMQTERFELDGRWGRRSAVG